LGTTIRIQLSVSVSLTWSCDHLQPVSITRRKTVNRLSDGARLSADFRSPISEKDRMMAAVKAARHGVLAPHLKPDHVGIASINSPMQCMMKEVYAQCLQKHVDPASGKETIIFSCFNQDQEMDRVDFPNLAAGAPAAEHRPGKAVQHVARPPPARPAAAARLERFSIWCSGAESTSSLSFVPFVSFVFDQVPNQASRRRETGRG